ncbi:MAG TPA: TonB family protein [Acidobacteriota bacterium]
MTTRIGKYEIIEELGRGAMGQVYKAYDSVLDRYVALKTVLPSMEVDRQVVERFYREAQLAAKLRHRNIVNIYDFGEHEQRPYLVMEYVYGTDLQRIIERRLEFSLEKRLNIALQICDGLGFAHAQGVIHRDIKPSNIRLNDAGKIQIMDFGVARPSGSTLTGTGQIVGAPAYMSPEQILGKPIDTRSDIFSLGIVLYEFFTYERPFPGESIHTIIYNIVNTEPRQVASGFIELPAGLEPILFKALRKSPDQRYQKVEELVGDLRALPVQTGEETTSMLLANTATEEARLIEIQLNLGRKFLQGRDYDKCQELIEKVFRLEPGHAGGRELQGRLAEARKNAQIEELFEAARAALSGKDIQKAQSCYGEVLKLDPGNQAATEMLQKMEQARTRRRVELLLQKARESQRAGRLSEAQKRVREAIQIDAENQEAVQLDQQLVAAIRKEHLDRMLAEGRKALAASDFATARNRFQALLKEEPELADARRGLEQVETAEKQARVDKLMAEGRKLLGAQDWAGAQARAQAALEILPQHGPAQQLLNEAQESAAEAERRKRTDQIVGQVRAALKAEELERAGGLIGALRDVDPDHAALAELRTELEELELAKAAEAEELVLDEPEEESGKPEERPEPGAAAAAASVEVDEAARTSLWAGSSPPMAAGAESQPQQVSETVLLSPSAPRADPARVHLELARQHFESGRNKEALDAFGRVLELDPGNAEAKAGLHEARIRKARERPQESGVRDAAVLRTGLESGSWWGNALTYLAEEVRTSRRWLLISGGAVVLLGIGFLTFQSLRSAPQPEVTPAAPALVAEKAATPSPSPDLELVPPEQIQAERARPQVERPGSRPAPPESSEPQGKIVPLKPPETSGLDAQGVDRVKREYEARLKDMEQQLQQQRDETARVEAQRAVLDEARIQEEARKEEEASRQAALPKPAPGAEAGDQPGAEKPAPKGEARVAEGTAVDAIPQVIERAAPSYPAAARRLKIAGRVIISVLVGEKGEVLQTKVVRSDNTMLENAALEAARQWKFIPASHNGKPVQSWFTLPAFDFRP